MHGLRVRRMTCGLWCVSCTWSKRVINCAIYSTRGQSSFDLRPTTSYSQFLDFYFIFAFVCLSVRPSVTGLRFSQSRKTVETSNLIETRVIKITHLRSKGQGHWKRKYENCFVLIIFVKNGSTYVIPRQKWSAVHSAHIVEYISTAEMLRFCDIWL